MLTLVFTYLYPLLTIPCILGYLPQIKEFILAREAPKGFAVSGWFIWLGENIVTMGYGLVVLQDTMFCFMTSLDTIFIAATICLAMYARHRHDMVNKKNTARLDFVSATLF